MPNDLFIASERRTTPTGTDVEEHKPRNARSVAKCNMHHRKPYGCGLQRELRWVSSRTILNDANERNGRQSSAWPVVFIMTSARNLGSDHEDEDGSMPMSGLEDFFPLG